MLLKILKMPPACAVCDRFPSHDGRFSKWISTLRIFQYVRAKHYHLLERFAQCEVASGKCEIRNLRSEITIFANCEDVNDFNVAVLNAFSN